jgi:hypothetical protein
MTVAAQNGHDAIVARLLAGGVAVDVANNEGLTALMMAAKVREERTAEVLLRYGADPSRRNKAGLSAERPSLLGAISNGHWEQYPTWGSPIRLSPPSGLRPTSTAPTPPPISMESASASRTNRPMSGIYRRLSSTCRLPKDSTNGNVRRVAAGNANKEVAAQLSIAEETVKAHMSSILSKLAAKDRTHAVMIGVKRGIIDA